MKFHELTKEAQEKAVEFYRGLDDIFTFESECLVEDLKERAALMGIEIDNFYYSGFWSQGDGACFEGSYSYKKGAATQIRRDFPNDTDLQEIADGLQALQRRYFYQLGATVTHRGHYLHENCTSIEHWHDVESADDEPEELLRDFMRYSYKCLEEGYDYATSEECIIEMIIASDYDFEEA